MIAVVHLLNLLVPMDKLKVYWHRIGHSISKLLKIPSHGRLERESMDILSDIYQLIKDDPYIKSHVGSNYMYNDFPDVPDIKTAYITINPVVPGEPVFYMDGKRTA